MSDPIELLSSDGLPRFSRLLKRGLDILISTLGLMLLAPLFALIGWCIRRDSPGPIFYTQARGGEGRRTFRIYKFRTMVDNAEAQLAGVLHLNMHADPRLYKIPNDPRVTPCGAFLRRYSLDELPQLINVLKGEMSLVGPRPLTLMEDRHVQGWAGLRATVKPGITGPWQVQGRNEIPFEEMMRLDCLYIANWSFLGDLLLLVRTIPAVFRPQRAN
jgi:lipopolysaccharide/colanic/teichoic acid biosynthesis glycosyltransferase